MRDTSSTMDEVAMKDETQFPASVMFGGSFEFSEPTIYDWVVPFGRASIENEAVDDAENLAATGQVSPRAQADDRSRFWITFEGGGGDIFTSQNVKSMCEVEQIFLNTQDYTRYCKLNSTSGNCAEPQFTITYAFYGTVANASCPLLSDSVKDTETRSPVFTERTRSQIDLGTPLEGYNSPTDRQSEQQIDFLDFYEYVKDDFFDFFNMEQQWFFSPYRERQEHNGIRCKWFSGPLTDIETTEIASGDLLLCIFSLAFVYGWMAFQMKNFFLSTFCMLQVIFSLPLAIVVYRSVFQVPYFQFIHILVIFLVLGIGADDVFVMYDGWRFSLDAPEIQEMIENEEDEDDILEKRMEISFTSSVGSIFTTSFTTIVSFLATSVSPVMPIGSFGILAATAILLNFILVISLVPAILVTNHVWFEKKKFCCYGMYRMILDERDEDKPSVLGDIMGDKRHIEMKEQKESTLGVKKDSIVDGINRKGSTSNLGVLSTAAMGQLYGNTTHEGKNANEDEKVIEENKEESQEILDKLVSKAYVPAMRQQYKGYHWVAIIMFVFFLIYGITSFAYGL
eukprot:jgi/Bigna1/140249/aug1.55_g14957